MNKELLIVGVDPGITSAYAVLNTSGRLLKLKSSKKLVLSSLIEEIIQDGKVIIIGSDVKNLPSFIEKLSSKLGAKVISPKEDMKIGFKERITENFKVKDSHQRDSLAAALFAYKEIKPLLDKINFALKKEGKEHIYYQVIELCIQGHSISDAISLLEEKEEVIKTRKRIRTKISRRNLLLEENLFLKKKNEELLNHVNYLNSKLEGLNKNIQKISEEKAGKLLNVKNKEIFRLNEELDKSKIDIENLKEKISDLTNLLINSKNMIVAKKFKTLSHNEVFNNIKENDVIIIDDVNIFSEKIFEYLKDKAATIVYIKKPSNEILKKSFTFIDANNLKIIDRENFALIDKNSFENAKKSSNIVFKIIEEYKDSRVNQLQDNQA